MSAAVRLCRSVPILVSSTRPEGRHLKRTARPGMAPNLLLGDRLRCPVPRAFGASSGRQTLNTAPTSSTRTGPPRTCTTTRIHAGASWAATLECPRAPACVGYPQKGDLQIKPPGGVFTEPDDHGLGRSRGGLTSKTRPRSQSLTCPNTALCNTLEQDSFTSS